MTTTIVATPELEHQPPRIRLDVTSNDANLATTNVVRRDSTGRTTPVRTADGGPLKLATVTGGRAGIAYDVEVPYGQPATYSTLEDPASRTPPVTLDPGTSWLIHPGIPSRSLPVGIRTIGDRELDVAEGIFEVEGRPDPIVITDGQRKTARATALLRTNTDQARRAMLALLSDASTLLLNVPASKAWGLGAEWWHVSAVRELRIAGAGPSWPAREWSVPYRVVGRPIGGTQADRTYNRARLEVASYNEGAARGRTYLEQQAPTD